MNAPLNVCTHANFVMTRWCAFGLSEPSCLMRLTNNHPSHFLIKFIQNGKSTVCPLLSFSAIVFFYRFLTIEFLIFFRLFCETAVVLLLRFLFKSCAGNWRADGQNWFPPSHMRDVWPLCLWRVTKICSPQGSGQEGPALPYWIMAEISISLIYT